jgi:N-succinyldiaminopimelate aminotransferase
VRAREVDRRKPVAEACYACRDPAPKRLPLAAMSSHVAGHWRGVAAKANLLGPDGSLAPTIFAEMSALAMRTGAINLGQGFPDTDGPPSLLAAAAEAIASGHNQYPPGRGIAALRAAVVEHQARFYGLRYDADTEVLVTAGATEALTATILALCEPGDEVVVLEPFYDSYAAAIELAGAVRRTVRLDFPGYRLDGERLAAAFSERTRLVVLNSPHNPTGRVFEQEELQLVAQAAIEHDVIVVTDEVYEHLTFDGARHLPLARFPGMRDRTVAISSAGKTFSVTGWKIGWACARPDLVDAILTVKQFLTYVNGAPFQPAVAQGLGSDDATYAGLARRLQSGRDMLVGGLLDAGFDVSMPQGTYFVVADAAPLGFADGRRLCLRLPELAGVVAVPVVAFHDDPAPARSLVRFAFCKRPEVLRQAAERLRALAG